MPYQIPITIKTALDRISKHDYVRPFNANSCGNLNKSIVSLTVSCRDFPLAHFSSGR